MPDRKQRTRSRSTTEHPDVGKRAVANVADFEDFKARKIQERERAAGRVGMTFQIEGDRVAIYFTREISKAGFTVDQAIEAGEILTQLGRAAKEGHSDG